MKKGLFIIFTLGFSLQILAQNATVKGIVKDADNFNLSDVSIEIDGQSTQLTDFDGNFAFEIPAGSHILNFYATDFETTSQNIDIKEGETISLEVILVAEAAQKELQDVKAVGTTNEGGENSLNNQVKKSEVIVQNIGNEEFARKGISDVKQGLSKITGVTFVENRGVVIRGLEDRYNNLLINNLAVPSNNPFKKIIALDLLPTDIVGVLEIFKTFNPDLYGDFGGATINVKTNKPQKSITKINFGFKYTTDNNLSSFNLAQSQGNFAGYYGGNVKNRNLPSYFGNRPAGKTLYGENAINVLKDGFNVNNSLSPISNSYGITQSGKIVSNKWKYLVSANFENDYKIRKGVERIFNLGQGNYDNNFNTQQYSYNTLFNALTSLMYSPGRSHFQGNVFYIRSTENIIKDQLGVVNSIVNNPNAFIRTNQFQVANFLNGQLLSDFYLSKANTHQIKTGISFTQTDYNQPDRKFIYGTKIDSKTILTQSGGNNLLRQYLDLKGNYQTSAFLEYNFQFGKNTENPNHLAIGYNGNFVDMTSIFRFVYGVPLSTPSATLVDVNNIDSYVDTQLLQGNIGFQEQSTGQYKTLLNQYINAAYATVFLKWKEKWEMNVGLRAEAENRTYKFRNVYDGFTSPYQRIDNKKIDFLPALNLKYKLKADQNLRFAASRTITKPVIMERFPLTYINADNTVVAGNVHLKDSDNYNADFKWELFPTNSEIITLSGFMKYLLNPIERTFVPTASSGGQIITYQNSKNATLFGFELESKIGLNRIFPSWDNVFLGFNASFLDTKVNISSENSLETYDHRALQGASKWMLNADIKYDFKLNKNFTSTLNLVYSVYSKRILAVGTTGFDHMYEMPFNRLDLVWSGNFSKNWGFQFSVKNLLNPNYKVEQGSKNKINITENSLLLRNYKEGVGFGMNLTYNF